MERELACRLDVPLTEEPGLEEYLVKLAYKVESGASQAELGLSPILSELPSPFRDPVTSGIPQRSLDMLTIDRLGLLAPAWAGGLVRARPFFRLKRWLLRRPSWWAESCPSMETPLGLSCVATWLTNADNAA